MKHKFLEEMNIPEGFHCAYEHGVLICSKGGKKIERNMIIPATSVKIGEGKIVFAAKKGNKKTLAKIKSWMAHIRNMFKGIEEEFVYKMEVCNVHFPMTVKVEGDQLVIANFLGEKEKRIAQILNDTKVKVSGNIVEVSSHDREAAGQTAANIEKATLVRKRDRRVFQDGIFITSKPGDEE